MAVNRGIRQFNQLFTEEQPPVADEVQRRGRSKQRHDRRNEMMLDRYYYYARIMRMRQPDVLSKIDAEFCIAPITITEIVGEKESYLSALKSKGVTTKEFQAKWQHLNWS